MENHMENHMENGNPISLKDLGNDAARTGKPEFKAEIKKAIDAAFQKDSFLEEFKIEYNDGKINPMYIKPQPNAVLVFIERSFDGCEHQYLIQTFICKYQSSVVCVFEESFSENLKNAISTSEWLSNINECYIRTTVTFK